MRVYSTKNQYDAEPLWKTWRKGVCHKTISPVAQSPGNDVMDGVLRTQQ